MSMYFILAMKFKPLLSALIIQKLTMVSDDKEMIMLVKYVTKYVTSEMEHEITERRLLPSGWPGHVMRVPEFVCRRTSWSQSGRRSEVLGFGGRGCGSVSTGVYLKFNILPTFNIRQYKQTISSSSSSASMMKTNQTHRKCITLDDNGKYLPPFIKTGRFLLLFFRYFRLFQVNWEHTGQMCTRYFRRKCGVCLRKILGY